MNEHPLILAYIGDGVYELLVRNYLCLNKKCSVNTLHKTAIKLVNASSQAGFLEVILPYLNDKEKDIVRRGRNSKSNSIPKNANTADYCHATAFEALFGYLYLNQEHERISYLFDIIMKSANI